MGWFLYAKAAQVACFPTNLTYKKDKINIKSFTFGWIGV